MAVRVFSPTQADDLLTYSCRFSVKSQLAAGRVVDENVWKIWEPLVAQGDPDAVIMTSLVGADDPATAAATLAEILHTFLGHSRLWVYQPLNSLPQLCDLCERHGHPLEVTPGTTMDLLTASVMSRHGKAFPHPELYAERDAEAAAAWLRMALYHQPECWRI